jgi:hypothetical protein
MAATQISHAHFHPPIGSMLAITDRGAAAHYNAPVDLHLGRYFYAAGHRFHVADDRQRNAERRTWKSLAATAVLLLPGEFDPAPAAPKPLPVPLALLAEPEGLAEPTEHW